MKTAALRWAQEVRIRSGPKIVLQALVRHMHPRTGDCFPSLKTLAKDSGLVKSTVRAALRDLEAHDLIHTESRRKGGRQTSNAYHLHVGAEPKPIGKRPDTLRKAKQRAAQAPDTGDWEEVSRHRNMATVKAPEIGPEYSNHRGREDGEVIRSQPGVGLAGKDLTQTPTLDLREAGRVPRVLGPRDRASPSPGWLPEDHGQGHGPAVEDHTLADDMAWAGGPLPEREIEAVAPWLDNDAAASEAQALGATHETGPSPQADDPLPEAVDEDPAPDRQERPKAEVMAVPPSATRPWSKEDWQVYFDERAGIAEFGGGLSRTEAEALAYRGCVAEWLDQHPMGSPANARERAAAALAAMGIPDPTDRMRREQQGDRVSPGWISRHQRARRSPGGERALPSRASSRVRPPVWQGSYGEAEGWAEGRRS